MPAEPLKIEESDNVPCDAQPAPSVESADAHDNVWFSAVPPMPKAPPADYVPRRFPYSFGPGPAIRGSDGTIYVEVIKPTRWERFVASPFVQFLKEFFNL